MRTWSLRAAEILTWCVISLTTFLALRIGAIMLTLLNPAICNDSCELGHHVLRVFLAVFVIGWFPWLILLCIRYARTHAELWWLPHCIIIAAVYTVAMVYVAQLFLGFNDADSRTPFLAFCAAAVDAVATVVLVSAVLLDRTVPPSTTIHFFGEDTGE
jgi:hypothetical protein